MIKRKGQRPTDVRPPSLKRMSDTEYAAYFEAFGAIKDHYQTLCLIGDKLREVETTARNLGPLDVPTPATLGESMDAAGDRSPWEVCASLMRLNQNEVVLCRRVCEHGLEYAVIDQSPVSSIHAKVNGRTEVLRTGDNPRQVLREFLRSERETLELMVNNITEDVRLLIAERFPKQDLRRVVNEITRACKSVARVGFSETLAETTAQVQQQGRGVRV